MRFWTPGPTIHGVESTVLDPCRSPMVIYRPGAITAEQIRAVAGPVVFLRRIRARQPPKQPEIGEALPSPGVGLRHYAPRARLILIEDSAPEGERTGANCPGVSGRRRRSTAPSGWVHAAGRVDGIGSPRGMFFPRGAWSAPEELAHQLYAGLRELDAQGCTVILCPVPRGDGIAAAIRDRLRKAAFPG